MTTQELKAALNLAHSKGFPTLASGAYLSNLDATTRAWLEVHFEDFGRPGESLLAYAERIRKG